MDEREALMEENLRLREECERIRADIMRLAAEIDAVAPAQHAVQRYEDVYYEQTVRCMGLSSAGRALAEKDKKIDELTKDLTCALDVIAQMSSL